ncbi:MAG: YihY family inner membrane protein [Burkholderiales bacterium]|nr:YihY family inner membrane protein [Burkholderiales bacterium]
MPSLADYRRNLITRLPAPLDFGVFVLRRLRDDRCLEAAGSLTFTTLLALIPFLTIALTVVSAFPMFQDFSVRFKIFLTSNLVPDAAGKIITIYMRQFTDNAYKLTAVGMLSLGVTAVAMMATIDKTFNRIWRVHRQRNWLVKTLTYWAILTLGPLLMGISLTLTGWIANQGAVLATLISSGSFLLAVAGLALMYRVVPNCPVPPRHAWTAAAAATLVLVVMRLLFSWYIRKFGTFKLVYGAFAAFPIFLLWLYVVWTIILAGAVISASLSYWHGEAWRRRPHAGQRVFDAVRLLLKLDEARRAGVTPTLDRLRRSLSLGQDELHELLQRLADKGWVQPTRFDGWVQSTALERITLKELFHLLVSKPLTTSRTADRMHTIVTAKFGQMEMALDVSLADLARQAHADEAASRQQG